MNTIMIVLLILSLLRCSVNTEHNTWDLFWFARVAALILFCIYY